MRYEREQMFAEFTIAVTNAFPRLSCEFSRHRVEGHITFTTTIFVRSFDQMTESEESTFSEW